MYSNYSRYKHSDLIKDEEYLQLGYPATIDYAGLDDDIPHVVQAGDTLPKLSATYYHSLPSPATYWWAIAEYQPDPILDPTIPLVVGSTLIIPSTATLQGWLLNPPEGEAIL